jgi:hypothetical protein
MQFPLLCSLALCVALLPVTKGNAQNFAGQWRGSFSSLSSFEKDEYVLELDISNQTQVSGYSYTYFDDYYGKRYFTICKLTGTVDRKTKTVTVTETEKIKGDVPPGNIDCLQTHILTYYKSDSGEVLEGKWKPAPGFDHGCGSGTTILSRKLLVRVPPSKAGTGAPKLAATPKPETGTPKTGTSTPKIKTPSTKPVTSPSSKKDTASHKPPVTALNPATTKPPLAKKPGSTSSAKPATGSAKPATGSPKSATGSAGATSKASSAAKPSKGATAGKGAVPNVGERKDLNQVQSSPSHLEAPQVGPVQITPPPAEVRQRTDKLIQTIDITNPDIQIELYDDGIIDHDTVTVYFNGKAVVYKNMLSHKPIKVTLKALPDQENELILFADNLGDIPPNTALMVVHVGEDIYDVRVSSDLSTNGVIRFRLKQAK